MRGKVFNQRSNYCFKKSYLTSKSTIHDQSGYWRMDSKSRSKHARMGKEDVIKPMNIVNDNMSDTPETDAVAAHEGNWDTKALRMTAHARKLERERNELQKAVNGLCLHFGVRPANTTLLAVEVLRIQREREEAITRRMETIMQCELYEQERDEAREALADWENAAAHVEADHPDERHCGCVPVLRKLLADARKERDEAWETLEYIASAGLSARHIQDYAKEFLSKK